MLMSNARIRYWGSRAPNPWIMLHNYRSWLKILNLGSLQASSSTSRLNEVWTERDRERERDEVLLFPFCSQSRSRVPKTRCKFIWSWACCEQSSSLWPWWCFNLQNCIVGDFVGHLGELHQPRGSGVVLSDNQYVFSLWACLNDACWCVWLLCMCQHFAYTVTVSLESTI